MSSAKIQMHKYKKALYFILICGIIAVLGIHKNTNLIKGIHAHIQAMHEKRYMRLLLKILPTHK